jgi:hypothetical protein
MAAETAINGVSERLHMMVYIPVHPIDTPFASRKIRGLARMVIEKVIMFGVMLYQGFGHGGNIWMSALIDMCCCSCWSIL